MGMSAYREIKAREDEWVLRLNDLLGAVRGSHLNLVGSQDLTVALLVCNLILPEEELQGYN